MLSFLLSFMEDFNKRFAMKPGRENSLFVPSPDEQEINYYLSIQYERVIDNGSAFSFFGSKLQLVDANGKTIRISKGTKIDLYKTFDNCIVAVHGGKFFETRKAVIDIIKPSKTHAPEKPKWKPSPNHPWRRHVTAKNRNLVETINLITTH